MQMLCDDVQSVRLMVALKFRRVKRAVERKAGGAILKNAVLAVLQAEQAVGEHRDAVLSPRTIYFSSAAGCGSKILLA